MGGNTLTDKRGCMLDNWWIRGTVKNSTGTVEDDGIPHDRLIAYTWKWSTTIEKKAEYLIENDESEVSQPVEIQKTEDLMSRFKNLF